MSEINLSYFFFLGRQNERIEIVFKSKINKKQRKRKAI